ncbi:hypothetical protein KSP40_PGU015053 [Platanthera guangdongensis]|uniref:Alpha-1,4 glucan phosphorylase n=1 Tax=Platanthera guangdongensis TaxID=2320717 RepID=A0ABR2M532_9ASPA
MLLPPGGPLLARITLLLVLSPPPENGPLIGIIHGRRCHALVTMSQHWSLLCISFFSLPVQIWASSYASHPATLGAGLIDAIGLLLHEYQEKKKVLFQLTMTENDKGSSLVFLTKKVPAVARPCAEEPWEVASNISYHAQYNPHFSPFKFDAEQAFYATARSVRDQLILRWNDTCYHNHKNDPKQTYYLSMEYLQGRALTNAIGNLDIQGAYADALTKLGHEIEEIAEMEKDAALGNGGLGRLASCFLDSMATLNLPAWGYGLRYRYGLFKQKISKDGQEELAEDWLEKFSPWELVRHDVVFPVRFFGHVEVTSTGS